VAGHAKEDGPDAIVIFSDGLDLAGGRLPSAFLCVYHRRPDDWSPRQRDTAKQWGHVKIQIGPLRGKSGSAREPAKLAKNNGWFGERIHVRSN
jgi:hypothetical protein